MKTGITRAAIATALCLFVAACHSHDPAPTPEPLETCNRFRLSTGEWICVHSRPLAAALQSHDHPGAAVEPLTDPNFSGPLEASVDLRSRTLDGCLQVRNQGECGWCVAHAVGEALDALYCAEGCPPPRVSLPALWEQGHMGAIADNDCVPGWQNADALAAASSGTPLPSEDTWAYSGTPRSMEGSRPGDDTLAMDPRYGATGSGSVTITHDATQLDQMKRVLSSGRILVVSSGVCFNNGWTSGAMTIQAPMGNCAANGMDQYDGYHAYTIVGYDDAAMEFIALNSWGQAWGQGGYMRLSYGFAQSELNDVGYLDQIDRTHGGCAMPTTTTTTAANRCAALTNCSSCAATSGCVFCDGACVAANATRNGPAMGTCTTTATTTAQCPAPSGTCTTNTDCDSCAGAGGCAWCPGVGCVSWPADHLACEDVTRIATEPEQCNDTVGTCEMAADCAACSALTGCGWCGTPMGTIHSTTGTTNCFGGAMNGPDRVACDPMQWSLSTGMCPMLDAGMGDAGGNINVDGGVASMDDGAITMLDGGHECHDLGGTCADRNECCGSDARSTIQCIQAFCEDTTMCVMNGGDCTDTVTHCCGLGLCGLDTSSRWECCLAPNNHCSADTDCCGYERCTDGVCQAQAVGQSCMNTQECDGAAFCLDDHTCGT